MLAILPNIICQCGYMSDNSDDFEVVDSSPFCLDCYDDNCVVRTCGGCNVKSSDFDYIKDYEVSEFETVYLCDDCACQCRKCGGSGCNYCYMTGY